MVLPKGPTRPGQPKKQELTVLDVAPVAGQTTGEAVYAVVLGDKETWLGTKADGTPTDYSMGKIETRLNARDNLTVGAVDSVNGETGAVVLDAADVGALPDDTVISGTVDLYEPHTWPSFDVTGSEWEANTYANYISGIDAKLADEITAGDVVKTSAGTSGAEAIYTYHVGPDHAPHVLLIGGSHPDEYTGAYASMRFFTELALGNSASLTALRERVQITWIPILTAHGYSPQSHYNANGYDVANNYPFLYDYDDQDASSHPRSATALSEPESQLVKSLIDDNHITCVIDCHTGGSQNPDMCWVTHEGWNTGAEHLAWAAATLWDQAYNTEDHSYGEFFYNYGASRTMMSPRGAANWAAKYLPWHLNRHTALGIILECDVASVDSVTASYNATWMTSRMARLYCGYLHHLIATWVTQGQHPRAIPERTYTSNSTATQTVTTTEAPVLLQETDNWGTVATSAFIDVPLRCPSRFVADVSLMLQADAAQTTAGRVRVRIGWGQSPFAGGDLTPLNDITVGYVDLPTASGYATYHRTFRLDAPIAITDDNPLLRFQVFVQRTAGDADPDLLAATVAITDVPENVLNRHAAIRRTS